MSYHVRITETAKQDLREIAFYIAEHSMDNETAKRFVMELREQCKRLVDFPQSGAIPKDHVLRSLDFRYIVHKDYLIFFKRPISCCILILTVVLVISMIRINKKVEALNQEQMEAMKKGQEESRAEA